METYNDLINQSDFACIGMVTASCNYSKLCIAIDRSFNFELVPLFCFDFMLDVVTKWREIINLPSEVIPEDLQKWNDLIIGSTFTDCNGKTFRQMGIKSLWVYLAYGNYIRINPLDDTPNGLRYKSNDFSTFLTAKEINYNADTYKNMALEIFKEVKEYLCINKDYFDSFDACNCQLNCGCNGKCSCGKTKRLSGFKFKTVKKR